MASTKIKEQSILGMCADNENLYVVSSNCFRANSVTCYDISGMKIKWQAKLKDMPYRITKEKGELKIFAVEDGCYCAPNYKRRTYTLDPATGNTLKVDKPANR